MKYTLLLLMCCMIFDACSGSSALEQKSTRALRETLAQQQTSDGSHTVLVTMQGFGDEQKKEVSLCGVTILVATPSVVTMIGTREELECVAKKPFVKSLELSQNKKTQ